MMQRLKSRDTEKVEKTEFHRRIRRRRIRRRRASGGTSGRKWP